MCKMSYMIAQLPRCTGCLILPCAHQVERHIHTASVCYLLALRCYQYLSMVRTGVWRGHMKEGAHLEDLGIDRSTILKWIFNRWDREHALD